MLSQQTMDTKTGNKLFILKVLVQNGATTRIALSKSTAFSRMSITNFVNELIEEGYVVELGATQTENGRKPVLIDVASNFPLVVAVQITRHYINAGISNLKGNFSNVSTSPLSAHETNSSILAKLYTLIDALVNEIDKQSIWGIGVSAMGSIDTAIGSMGQSHYLNELSGLNVKQALENHYGMPVYFDNDLNVLALAEKYFGNAKQYRSFAVLGSSIGLGCGIVIDNVLQVGGNLHGPEIGHVTVNIDGPRCYCGNYGCLELYAAIGNIVKWAQDKQVELTGKCEVNNWQDLLEGSRNGHPIYKMATDRLAHYIAAGCLTIANLFDPECIFLGEDLSDAYDIIGQTVEEIVNERKFSGKNDRVYIKTSCFRGAAPLIGPVANVLDRIFSAIATNEKYQNVPKRSK